MQQIKRKLEDVLKKLDTLYSKLCMGSVSLLSFCYFVQLESNTLCFPPGLHVLMIGFFFIAAFIVKSLLFWVYHYSAHTIFLPCA